MTLEELKNRPLNKYMYDSMYETWELGDEHNMGVARHRMESGDVNDIKTEVWDMVHNGNEPKSNVEMLDYARCFYEDKVYTDEEWEKYFLPAINEMLEHNNTFERWYPGYLIRNKETGNLAIVEADYAFKYGGRDFKSLDISELNKNGDIIGSWAWANYDNYELVDKTHMVENLEKIGKFKEKY